MLNVIVFINLYQIKINTTITLSFSSYLRSFKLYFETIYKFYNIHLKTFFCMNNIKQYETKAFSDSEAFKSHRS